MYRLRKKREKRGRKRKKEGHIPFYLYYPYLGILREALSKMGCVPLLS
jgi:hypothetical protein